MTVTFTIINFPHYKKPISSHTYNVILSRYQSIKSKIENEVLRKLHPHTQKTVYAFRGDIDRT